MKYLGWLKVIRLSAFAMLLLVLAASSCSQKRTSAAEPLAKTYGVDSFGQVDEIRYTFNAEFPGVTVSRSWDWQPKTGQVSYQAKDKEGKPVKVTYVRSQVNSQSDAVK